MLVKVEAISISIGRFLTELCVQMLRLFTNIGFPCLQVTNINLYFFGFEV